MSRRQRNAVFLVPFLALACGFLAPAPAHALPLWARKYSMPCTSCHLAFPRLNDFGMKFRQRGYLMEGQEGESPWEGGVFPLSVVGNVGYDVLSTSRYNGTDWTRFTTAAFVQNQVELHSAGTLAKKITFHFDNNFEGVGGPLLSGMAFVQFDDVAKDGKLNVKVGIFDAEVPYLSSSRRTTWHDYLLPGTLPAEGIELNGSQSGWTYAVALLNSGRDTASVNLKKPGTKSLNNLESPYAWLMRDIGPHKVTARVFLDPQNPRVAGKASSQHLQVDLNALLEFGRFWVIPDYTYEHFADADSGGIPEKVHRGLLEGVVLLDKGARCLLTGRYELAHSPSSDILPEADLSLATLDLAYYVNPNAKIVLDWSRTWDNLRGDRTDEAQLQVHVGF